MKTAKRKGTKNERRSRALLEALGYRVTRSAASLGPWDLVAYNESRWLVCQVKSNVVPYGREWGELRLAAAGMPPQTKKVIHVWHDRQREPEVLGL